MKIGANVPASKTLLSRVELDVLRTLIKTSGVMTADDISNRHDFDIRKASSILSNLVGMDLIKTQKSELLTEEEESLTWKTLKTPTYWVGNKGTIIYKRACLVSEQDGKLRDLDLDNYQWEERLFPLNERMVKIIVLPNTASMNRLIDISYMDDTVRQFLRLHNNKPIKVTLEIAG
jgi:hypothetical protein